MFRSSPRPKAKPIRRKLRHSSRPTPRLPRIEALEPRNLLSITVNSLADDGAINPATSAYVDLGGTIITLRSALEAANARGGDITIDFAITDKNGY